MAELIDDGALPRHIRAMRVLYHERRDALVASLRGRLGEVVDFEVPRGGLSIWARAAGVDVEAWCRACESKGVLVRSGSEYAFDSKPVSAVRLVFAPLNPREIDLAVERMAAALASVPCR